MSEIIFILFNYIRSFIHLFIHSSIHPFTLSSIYQLCRDVGTGFGVAYNREEAVDLLREVGLKTVSWVPTGYSHPYGKEI